MGSQGRLKAENKFNIHNVACQTESLYFELFKKQKDKVQNLIIFDTFIWSFTALLPFIPSYKIRPVALDLLYWGMALLPSHTSDIQIYDL